MGLPLRFCDFIHCATALPPGGVFLIRFNRWTTGGAISAFVLFGTVAAAWADDKSALVKWGEELAAVKTLSDIARSGIHAECHFEMVIPTSIVVPLQDTTTATCIIALNGDEIGVNVTYQYLKPPRFIGLGECGNTSIDYDDEGNYIFWQSSSAVALMTSTSATRREVSEMFIINKQDEIVTRSKCNSWRRMRVGDINCVRELGALQSATGLSVGEYLGRHVPAVTMANGKMRAEGRGSEGGMMRGRWVFERGVAGPTVPERARFYTADNSTTPVLDIFTTGTIRLDPVTMGETGSITYAILPGLEHKIRVIVKKLNSPAHSDELALIKKMLEVRSPGSFQILDETGPNVKCIQDGT